MVLRPPAPGGATAETRIAGAPWWPGGTERPRCPDCQELMAFMAQVRLDELPGSSFVDSLLSFHYCQECTYEGNMSFGGHRFRIESGPFGGRGYDVRILTDVDRLTADGLGEVAESPLPAHRVDLENVEEIPSIDDMPEEVCDLAPEDYPQLEDDLDENVYPGLVHVARSKVGGWPTWVQDADWPMLETGERLEFVAQLDWDLGADASWGGGGYAYLFAAPDGRETEGELLIQTT